MSDDAPVLRASLILGSRFCDIEVAERAVADLCSLGECNAEESYWVVTALREALANAIRHGNRLDTARRVRVECALETGRLTIRVEDEGDGFDVSAVPDPTAAENLLRPTGRGIFYMRQFMNRVEFGRTPAGGTSVLMVRELRPSARSVCHEE